MSRTYRKDPIKDGRSKEQFLKDKLGRILHKYHGERYDRAWPEWDDVDYYAEMYDKYSRDGFFKETPRNKIFKQYCKKDIRAKTRELNTKVKADPEYYDEIVYPGNRDTKKHIWRVW